MNTEQRETLKADGNFFFWFNFFFSGLKEKESDIRIMKEMKQSTADDTLKLKF